MIRFIRCIAVTVAVACVLLGVLVVNMYRDGRFVATTSVAATETLTPTPIAPKRTSVAQPAFVKGIYITTSTVSSAKRFAALVDLVGRTELNTLVIDIKNDAGELAFRTLNPKLAPYQQRKPDLGDINALTTALHDKGVYLIARLYVVQDPLLATQRPELSLRRDGGMPWLDNKGRGWVDPAAEEVWKYAVEVAREVHSAGFDEIQFDYVRFPSDGKMSDIRYPFYDGVTPKQDVMEQNFRYLDSQLRQRGIPISVDLFGLVLWAKNTDMNIGQRLLKDASFFDAISPMVYPSHYPRGFLGYANPANYPYEVVFKNMERGQPILTELRAQYEATQKTNPAFVVPNVGTLRPWIQDFNLGATYTPDMVRSQMKAVADGGGSGWLLWNARNVYTESALLRE